MNRLSLSLSSVLLLSAFVAVTPAHAAQRPATGDSDTISVVLNMTSMDLNSARGWHDATRSINETSEKICARLVNQQTILPVEVSDCQENTTLEAMRQLESVRKTQSDNRRSGRALLALSGQL